MLGKRKRRPEEASQPSPQEVGSADSESGILHEAFRRHFEAQFKPLGGLKLKTRDVSTPTLDADSDSEWNGFSEPEDGRTVEVVECTAPPKASLAGVPKEELKSFMTSKPPSSSSRTKQAVSKSDDDSDDATDAANIRNDLALQRLLAESHLLDPQSSYSPTGANRHKATDLRLQSLGAKASILSQDKMPMSHRKGIIAKASRREERRRREARENGIILEKARKSRGPNIDRRERSIDGPGVGMFRKGMLRLNKRDISEIEGSKRPGGRSQKKTSRR
ncbi:hypothetical protein GP486_008275 [Trichoglossum hirsutum]|uniref:Uncharacterized protein n=1 Tax=Trichoglossum hirsutum TaxID=265104 RepID=A0A9P8L6F3_9PEZI|nr:hypothetical protein GP486_008275 [Trichoglossum hirsutum]